MFNTIDNAIKKLTTITDNLDKLYDAELVKQQKMEENKNSLAVKIALSKFESQRAKKISDNIRKLYT